MSIVDSAIYQSVNVVLVQLKQNGRELLQDGAFLLSRGRRQAVLDTNLRVQ